MNNTNVEYYIAGFDADGKRVGSSICEFDPKKSKNVNKLDELKKEAKPKGFASQMLHFKSRGAQIAMSPSSPVRMRTAFSIG